MLARLPRPQIVTLLTNGKLLSVSAGHFTVDSFANLLPMMYPLLTDSLKLNYALVGLAIGLNTLASSLSQPVFGYIADRIGGRHLAAIGVAWTATFIAVLGFAWDYGSFVAILVLAGLGTAAFHPQGAMNTAEIGGARKTTAMSVFMLGGTAGFAVGPLLGAAVFSSQLGLHGSLILLIPGLAAAAWLYRAIGRVDLARQAVVQQRGPRESGRGLAIPIFAVTALVIVVMLRSWTGSALNNFIPLLFKERGLPLGFASQVLFTQLIATAVGGVVGAMVADAWGKRRVAAVTLAASGPAIALFFQASPEFALPAAALVGLLLGASMSITLVMGLELMPNSVGMASGLILGVGFATGGLGVSLTGFMADSMGLANALNIIWVLPIVAALGCLGLGRGRRPTRLSSPT